MAAPRLGKAEEQQRQAALSLLRRLPPQDFEQSLTGFAKIAPHLEQSLAPYVNKPLKVVRDPGQNRYFVACDFNVDGGSHRSPWSNKYFPPPKGGDAEEEKLFRPSFRLRRLEESFNEVFDAYKTSYYEGGVSSVYLWDLDEGFAGAFLIRKELAQSRGVEKGVWDSVHVLEVRESPNSNVVEYKLLTTVLVHVEVGKVAGSGETKLASLITRQAEDKRKKVGEDLHLIHIGRLIEEMEISIRSSLDNLYLAKQREILSAVRLADTLEPCQPIPPPGREEDARAKAQGR